MHETGRAGGVIRTGRRTDLRCGMLIPSAGMTRIRFDGSVARHLSASLEAPRETSVVLADFRPDHKAERPSRPVTLSCEGFAVEGVAGFCLGKGASPGALTHAAFLARL